MALIKCRECKKEVSSKSKQCPHCGAPVISRIVGCGGLLLICGTIFILFVFLLMFESPIFNNEVPDSQEEHFNKIKQEILKKRKVNFKKNRDEIISNGRTLFERQKYKDALGVLYDYQHVDDPELQNLLNKIKESKLAEEVKKIPAYKIDANKKFYEKLSNLNPKSELYKQKLSFYKSKIKVRDERIRTQNQKQQKDRNRRISNFGEAPIQSKWDGSYFEVENYLAETMHDPKSLDMDKCTKVFHTFNGWVVGCIYRGKNAFGGIVRNANWFTIKYGRVVQMHDTDKYSWAN